MPDGPAQKIAHEGHSAKHTEAQPEQREYDRAALSGERSAYEAVPVEGFPHIPTPSPAPAQFSKKSPLLTDIENILEEGLVSFYKELTPRQKAQFKTEGERTARKVEELMRRVKVAVIEIVRFIRTWLRLIPGINIFFLEQEAKIKAERIIALKKK